VDFEQVGIGERLVYLQSAGIFSQQHIPAEVEKLVLEAGKTVGIQPLQGSSAWGINESGLARENGFTSVCVLALPQASNLLPEWHRLTDTANRLQESALTRAHEFGWALLQVYNPANRSFSRSLEPTGGEERINKS